MCWTLTRTFFVQAAEQTLDARYQKIFALAWLGKGFVIDLSSVPDHVMDLFMELANKKISEENQNFPTP